MATVLVLLVAIQRDNLLVGMPLTEDATIQWLLKRNNELRLAAGKPAQELNEQLCRHAMAHARWMAANRTLAHSQSVGRAGWPTYVDESCAVRLAADPIGLMNDPVKCPAHRQMLLANYRYCGFGVGYAADGTPYWVTCYAN